MPTETSLLVLRLKSREFNRGLDVSNKKLERLNKSARDAEKGIKGYDGTQQRTGKNSRSLTDNLTTGAAAFALIKSKSNEAVNSLVSVNKVSASGIKIMGKLRKALFGSMPQREGRLRFGGGINFGRSMDGKFLEQGMFRKAFEKTATAAHHLSNRMARLANKTAFSIKKLMAMPAVLLAMKAAAIGAAIAIGKLTMASLRWANQQELVEAKVKGVLRATGGAGGIGFNELKDTAFQLQKATGIADENILNMFAVLSTFKSIRGDVFKRASKSIIDLSKVMGTDLKSAALQVGKALENPKIGVSALQEVGVTFTDKQKDMIKSLQATGKLVEAQRIVMEALEGQVRDTAEAMGNTTSGKLDKLGNNFKTVAENVMNGVKHWTSFGDGLEKANKFMEQLARSTKNFGAVLDTLNKKDAMQAALAFLAAGLPGAAAVLGAKGGKRAAELEGAGIAVKGIVGLLGEGIKALGEGLESPAKKAAAANQFVPTAIVGDALAGSVGAARVRAESGFQIVMRQVAENTARTADAVEMMATGGGNPIAPTPAVPGGM